MSIEKKIDDLSALLTQVLAKLEHIDQATTTVTETVGDVSIKTETKTPVVAANESSAAGQESTSSAAGQVVAGGGAVVTTAPVLTMTAKADGATAEDFLNVGWTEEGMIQQGYAILETAAAAPAVVVTAAQVNEAMIEKATALGDDGAAIFIMLQSKFGVSGVSDIDPAKLGQVLTELQAL